MTRGLSSIPMRDYLAIKAFSSGVAFTILAQSPYHARKAFEAPADDPSSESDFGTAVHDGFLEGADRIAVIDAPDWRTKAAKEERERARLAGMVPLLAHKAEAAKACIEAATAFLPISGIAGWLDHGEPELTVQWTEDRAPCKARPDWLDLERGRILHVKTTPGSAEPSAWIRNQLTGNGYDLSYVLYERGISTVTDQPLHSVFLVIEQEPPHGCSLIDLGPAQYDLSQRRLQRALAAWQKGLDTHTWPSYDTRIHSAEPKPWEMAQEDERAMDEWDPELGRQA